VLQYLHNLSRNPDICAIIGLPERLSGRVFEGILQSLLEVMADYLSFWFVNTHLLRTPQDGVGIAQAGGTKE